MTNKILVPLTVAPDDFSARQDGEAIERTFRTLIATMRSACRVPPQPRWLFEDVKSGKPMSMAQLGRAFSILAKHPDITAARVAEAAGQFAAVMKGCATVVQDAGLASLLIAETEAQGAADVLQLRATLTNGEDPAAVARALESTVKHQVTVDQMATALASRLNLVERRRVVRPTLRIASKGKA
jgi:hypothetical protein